MNPALTKDMNIYLDHNATTPVDPAVFEAMKPYFEMQYGNPASTLHHWGWAAQSATEKARQLVAGLLNANPLEITFTSGATESNNTVIFGLISKLQEQNPDEEVHIISSSTEHSSVLKTLIAAAKMKHIAVDFLPVDQYGIVDLNDLKTAMRPSTKLISLIWVNNEIGSINPIAEAAQIAREHKIYFHTDATQAVGKIPVDLSAIPVDMLSFSSHKIYGPKGIGVLYLRGRNPKVQINPIIFGGDQERGLRSGTLNVAAIVGLGKACEIAERHGADESLHLKKLRDLLWSELQKAIPGIQLNGHPEKRSPMNLNVTFPKTPIEQMLPKLQHLAFSSSAACTPGTLFVSHVLRALGLPDEAIQRTLRLGIGRFTTEDEVLRAAQLLVHAAEIK
jgi:cysteine desulfurase